MFDPWSGESAPPAVPDGGASAGAVSVSLRGNDLLIRPLDEAAPEQETQLRRRLVEAAGGERLLYDRRLGAYRTVAGSYHAVRERLERDQYTVHADFEPFAALPFGPSLAQALRPYQDEALAAWEAAGRRGVVVLPTGAGKTLVALAAIATCAVWTLVVVPTLDLLEQWRRAAIDNLGVPAEHVGTFGGGKRRLAPITIITYDSAVLHTRALNRFGLLVFDEVHHLPAAANRRAADGALGPARLGLTATLERADGLERDLARLVGPTVYSRTPQQLGGYLAPFQERRLIVRLDPVEAVAYRSAIQLYRDYIRRRRLRIESPEDFQRFILWPSANNAEARQAMLAHRRARTLAFNAAGKLRTVVQLLERHRDDRVLIFSEYNDVVEDLSRRLLIPSITHKTPAAERQAVLDGFRTGRFTKLATGRVLNEGVDVPDANVAIVISGSGTRREYVQRLGRILRPKAQTAVLYELVAEGTSEIYLHRRRHQESRRGAANGGPDGSTDGS